MDQSPRGRPARISSATYWRRRVTVLAVGIGLLATISWAANGLLAARSAADQAPRPAVTKSASSSPGHQRRIRASATPSPRSSPAPTRRHHSAAACAPGAVTLRLSSPQYWYQPGATPRFTVTAVSGQARPCRFNMGTRFVSVVITDAGRRVWSSADCASGGGSNMIVLTQGVRAVLRLSWDRRTSSPGCDGTRQAVPAGEYQVAAVAGPIRSATQHMVLGAKGVSGP